MATMPDVRKSGHAVTRQAQRGIREQQLELTLQYGQRLCLTGAVIYFLRRRDIPRWVDGQMADRFNGTVAIVSQDGAVITMYRNPDGLAPLKRRSKRAWLQ